MCGARGLDLLRVISRFRFGLMLKMLLQVNMCFQDIRAFSQLQLVLAILMQLFHREVVQIMRSLVLYRVSPQIRGILYPLFFRQMDCAPSM